MTILIVGASGFIGRHLCENLGKTHRVIGVVKQNTDLLGCEQIIKCDLLNKERTVEILQKEVHCRIDILINLASKLVGVETAEDIQVLLDNIKMTESIVEISKKLAIQKLINFSSIAVYPNTDGTFSEESPVWMASNSECLYGLSKFCSENILDYLLKNRGTSIIHLRLAQVHGDGMREDRIMSMMRNELVEKNQITVFGNGERISNFISIEKVCRIIEALLNSTAQGVYNLGDENLSYEELAKRIIKKSGINGKIVLEDKGSKAKFFLDSSKLGQLIKSHTTVIK
ncbi:MAG: NAD(P)-dependent oxidoreductase [Sulfuricurvum sp.]|jgi:nucleoside-diphosphate-sugar epimerase